MRTTIVNVGTIVSGDWRQPLTDGDSVSMIDGRIDSVGVVSERSVRDSDVVIDADGATVCLGGGFADGLSFGLFGDSVAILCMTASGMTLSLGIRMPMPYAESDARCVLALPSYSDGSTIS